MKPRILHVLPHARTLGGTERTVLDLLDSPELDGFEQRVVFSQGGRIRGFRPEQVLPRRRPGGAVAAALGFRPDLVHGWLLRGNLAGAAIKLLTPGVRLVTSERNVGHALTPAKALLERVVAAAEDVTTANSQAVLRAAVRRLPRRAARMRVLAPGVAAPLRPAAPVACDAVMVGRLHPVKAHETALGAWALVRRSRPRAQLVIVGDGPLRPSLERRAAELGLDGGVRFAGETDPAPYLYGARLYLASSRAEGFSRALLEALAAGVPAVSTDVGGVDELPRRAVARVPVGDAAGMASAALVLLEDAAAYREAVAAAGEAAARHRPSESHAAHARLYRELLG